MQTPHFLRCPDCYGTLKNADSQLTCDNCEKIYQFKNGIYDFSSNNSFPTLDVNDGLQGASSWKNLIAYHKIITRKEHNFQEMVDILTGEYINFFKFLLPDISYSDILYLGSNDNETPHNIARRAGSLTVLLTTDNDLMLVMHKNRLRKPRQNIVYIAADNHTLPFSIQSFDGVIIDQSIAPHIINNFGADSLLSKLNKIIKPNGWLYVKSENPYSRLKTISFYSTIISFLALTQHKTLVSKKEALNTLKPSFITNKISINNYQEFLKNAGFTSQRIAAFDNNKLSIINLHDKHHINKHITSEKGLLKNIPAWLYKRTVPITGIFAQRNKLDSSIIENIIRMALKNLGIDRQYCEIVSITSNIKCKCIIILNITQPHIHSIIIKIPIDELSERNLIHNHNGLIHLDSFSNSTFFPKPISSDCYINTPYYVEYGISGVPWSHYRYFEGINFLIEDIVNAIKGIRWLSTKYSNDKILSDFYQRIDDIAIWSNIYSSDDHINLKALLSDVELTTKGESTPVYFYKSDFSVSNIFINEKKLSGIIDLDFWGYSHNKLVDYADFIESFSRNFLSMNQSDILIKIHNEELSAFQPALDINRHLRILGGDINELKKASLIAWINRVHHAFEFKRVTLNDQKTKELFFDPLRKLISTSNIFT